MCPSFGSYGPWRLPWECCFWLVSSLRGGRCVPLAFMWPQPKRAASSTFLRGCTGCISSEAWRRSFSWLCGDLKGRTFRAPLPPDWRPTTGTSWTGYGSSCCRFFILGGRTIFCAPRGAAGLLSAFYKFQNCVRDANDLLRAQLGEHREREHFLRGALRVVEVARLVAE